MDLTSYIQNQFVASAKVKQEMAEKLADSVAAVAKVMIRVLQDGGKILWCGNGGSAADSQHLATELISRLRMERPAIPSIALTTNTSLITAHTNDYDFDSIFSRQVEAFGRKGDILVGISTSGNSKNIVDAFKTAQIKEMIRIALLGKDGGILKNCSDYSLIVPSNDTQRIQEGHITIGHVLCDLVEMNLYGGGNYSAHETHEK